MRSDNTGDKFELLTARQTVTSWVAGRESGLKLALVKQRHPNSEIAVWDN